MNPSIKTSGDYVVAKGEAALVFDEESFDLVLPEPEDENQAIPPHCVIVSAIAAMVTHERDLLQEAINRFHKRIDAQRAAHGEEG